MRGRPKLPPDQKVNKYPRTAMVYLNDALFAHLKAMGPNVSETLRSLVEKEAKRRKM